jgi:2-polyprenyl-3-methyl-5-hydroxy-6-metoxy-1,4-benzoquinol methylase
MLLGEIAGLRLRLKHMTDREHWFEDLASHMKAAYLRYSFTKGTIQEVDFILDSTGAVVGSSFIDVGCGPGRHSLELARRGMRVCGIDVSQDFIDIARRQASDESLSDAEFVRLDARSLQNELSLHAQFDFAICLCQGAFGLMVDDRQDVDILKGIRKCLKPNGVVVLSAFNAYFSVKHHDEAEFDARTGVSHETTDIRNDNGEVKSVDLWTGCYTPRELRLVFELAGFDMVSMSSVEPGHYSAAECSTELPEFLVIAKSR